MAHEAANYAPKGSEASLAANLVDIHNQRLELMDKYGVEMQVLSLTSPGPQGMLVKEYSDVGISDPTESAKLASHANDVLVFPCFYGVDEVRGSRQESSPFRSIRIFVNA